MSKLPFIQRVGKYHYFRRNGYRVRLPSTPGSERYQSAYQEALNANAAPEEKRRRGMRRVSKYVYLIRRPWRADRVKIGISCEIKSRLLNLQAGTGSPKKYVVLKALNVGSPLALHIENGFKALMQERWIVGEWYLCNPMLARLGLYVAESGDLIAASIARALISGDVTFLTSEQRVYFQSLRPILQCASLMHTRVSPTR